MDEKVKCTLENILRYCEDIQNIVKEDGVDMDLFLSEKKYNMSISFALFQIGECVKSIDDWLNANSKAVDWNDICRLRDIIGHRYHVIDNTMLWGVVTDDIEPLKNEVQKLLA